MGYPVYGNLPMFLVPGLPRIEDEMNIQPLLGENCLILQVVLSTGNSTDSNFLTIKNIRKHEPSA